MSILNAIFGRLINILLILWRYLEIELYKGTKILFKTDKSIIFVKWVRYTKFFFLFFSSV
jgi:hypothetical protein